MKRKENFLELDEQSVCEGDAYLGLIIGRDGMIEQIVFGFINEDVLTYTTGYNG